MSSIRLSLILYFLLLLGAALSGVGFFCYQSTQEALAAKAKSAAALRKKQFEENKARVENEFDVKLHNQARALAGKVVWVFHRLEGLNALGVLGSQAFTGGPFTMGLPLWQSCPAPHAPRNSAPRGHRLDLRIDEDPLLATEEGQHFRTYTASIRDQLVPLESSDSTLAWNFSREARDKVDEGQVFFDAAQLKSGQTVRRITLKANVNFIRRGLVLVNSSPKWLPPVGKDQRIEHISKPTVYLQYGMETSARDGEIAKLKVDFKHDLEIMPEELNQACAELRTRLLWIGLCTFAALAVGGFVLVWLGLAPLRRLSDAVSRVSEKDFYLPIDQNRLPRELKPIAGRLAQTLEQLKSAFAREKQAAADISHELRTPVAALLTTLEIALRKPRSAEEYREVLADCRESGQHVSQLVERLLALARLDASAEQLRRCEVDAVALAKECVALVRPLAEVRGLRVAVHHSGPASLNADPTKLREVLTNLLHNAIEYNRPQGAIDVRVARNNGHLDMEVRDTGIGIASEVRQHIFERFFRVDPSRHANTPHAGLGLAIVKGYVDLMGGSIEVDSAVGAGSTFRVRLPVAAQ